MRFKRGQFVISQMRQEIVRYRILACLLLTIIIMLSLALNQNKQRTIIIPPDRAKYILEDFAPEYIEGFVLMWQKSLLDYTPANCFHRESLLAPYLSSRALLEKIKQENDFIRREKISQRFFPKKMKIDSDKATFSGTLTRDFGQESISKEIKMTFILSQGSLGQPMIKQWQMEDLT